MRYRCAKYGGDYQVLDDDRIVVSVPERWQAINVVDELERASKRLRVICAWLAVEVSEGWASKELGVDRMDLRRMRDEAIGSVIGQDNYVCAMPSGDHLWPGEGDAVESVVAAGKQFGYGNMIGHLQRAWARHLGSDTCPGMTDNMAEFSDKIKELCIMEVGGACWDQPARDLHDGIMKAARSAFGGQ